MIWLNGLGFEFFCVIHGDFIRDERGFILSWLQGIKGMMHEVLGVLHAEKFRSIYNRNFYFPLLISVINIKIKESL
jgi:hypothetical protein